LSCGADLDGAVAACGSPEFYYAPPGLVFDPVADRQCGEHNRVGFDRLAFVVIDRPGLQVVFGHPEALLDPPQLVVGVDDELGGRVGEVGGYADVGVMPTGDVSCLVGVVPGLDCSA
jgi:hypothetical protein